MPPRRSLRQMRPILLALLALAASLGAADAPAPPLSLRPGDHIAILGAGPIEREQHAGWLETLLQLAYPDHGLVVRNLAFSGDEVDVHPRSSGVPPTAYFLNLRPGQVTVTEPDGDKVTYCAGADFHASVILAQWGFNESFAGPAGAEAFRRRLDAWVVAQLKADHGQGRPRIVLLTPFAQRPAAGMPDLNPNLALYAEQVRAVAAARGVPCVDLHRLSERLLAAPGAPTSVNGLYLDDAAERRLAPALLKALLGVEPPDLETARASAVRAAVLEKNRQWRARYRSLDQYNIYGERSRIAYADANDPKARVTNAEILGQEMAQRDVITARCDRAVWAAAQGRPVAPDLSGLPSVDPVPPNVPPRPYLTGEETLRHLKVPEGCRIELVADETTLPGLVNPVQLGFDPKGRLWVAVWPTYPEPRPGDSQSDKLLVIDLDPATGKVARATTFLDGLSCPTGFQFYRGGVLLMQAPDLLWIRDTDGDGRGDTTVRLLQGMDSADTHHTSNSLVREPGGAVYLSDGDFHRTSVESAWGPVRNRNGAIYRFEPNTGKFTRHVPYRFANPHGRVFDRWGNDIVTDGTMNANYFGPAFSGHLDEGAHPAMEEFWDRPSRPSPGTALLSSRHFPDDWQGDFLNCNVIGYQGIFRAKVSERGSGLHAVTRPEGLVQADIAKAQHFRPVGAAVAPDGSVYVIDWSQQIIGHLQHHLRDPNRDHAHGRIYRITYPSRPLLAPKAIAGQPIAALLDLLKEPEDGVRMRAKLELETRPVAEVIASLDRWVAGLDRADPEFEHHRLEALWVHQWFDAVSPGLLADVLRSPELRARAQAVRVLGYWRDRVPGALDLLESVARDPHLRVRLEVVRVCSFFRDADAARALRIAELSRGDADYYIRYCLAQTRAQLLRFPAAKAVDLAPVEPGPVLAGDQPPSHLHGADGELWSRGREVYLREGSCVTCHQKDGKGLRPAFPPLAGSEWVGRPDARLIKIVLHGLNGPLTVRGEAYGPDKGSPPMPGFRDLLDDRDVAAVLTYVRNAFGNRQPAVKPETVATWRERTKDRSGFWSPDELLRDHPAAPARR